jgi:hypothetical protein
VTGGSLGINLRDQTLLENHLCNNATSCVRAFAYGHFAIAGFDSFALPGEVATTFHDTCPPGSDTPGTFASSGPATSLVAALRASS